MKPRKYSDALDVGPVAQHTPTPWKRNWTVWFTGTSKADFIEAYSRKEAIAIFANKEGVNVSSYIQARPSTFVEFKGGS